MVIAKQQLISKDGGHELGLVVGQAAMPDPLVDAEVSFEPVVEGFDACPAPRIEPLTLGAVVEGLALEPETAGQLGGLGQSVRPRIGGAGSLGRTDKVPSGGPALGIAFHALAVVVAVVAAVSQDVTGSPRQVIDLVAKAGLFGGVGPVGRCLLYTSDAADE